MQDRPAWLTPRRDDALLRAAGIDLRWSAADATLTGSLDGAPLTLDLADGATLMLSRSLRPGRSLGWAFAHRRPRHLLHVELGVGRQVVRLTAAVKPASVDGLPWQADEGHEVPADDLVRMVQALLGEPSTRLADWAADATVDPRVRARAPVAQPPAEDMAPPAKASPRAKGGAPASKSVQATKRPARTRPLNLFGGVTSTGVIVCLFGFGFTTVFTSIGLASKPWMGFGGGVLVALMTQIGGVPKRGDFESAERWASYARWAVLFLPIYGVLFGLLQPALTLADPERSDVVNAKSGQVDDVFFRFAGAEVATDALLRADGVAVAPIVARHGEPAGEPVLWALCEGSEAAIAGCIERWSAAAGTLDAESLDRLEQGAPPPLNKAAELVRHARNTDQRLYFFRVVASDLTFPMVWGRRLLFFAGLAVLALAWMRLAARSYKAAEA